MQPLAREEIMQRLQAVMRPEEEEGMQLEPTIKSETSPGIKQEVSPDVNSGLPATAEPEACLEERPVFRSIQQQRASEKKRLVKSRKMQSNLLTQWSKASEKRKRPEPESQPPPAADSAESEDGMQISIFYGGARANRIAIADPAVKMEIDSDEYEAGGDPVPATDEVEYAKKRKEKQDELVKMMDEDEDEDLDEGIAPNPPAF